MSERIINYGGYTVKSVKSFNGMEGNGFNCNLYLNNKKVAECIEEGRGGELNVHWTDGARYGKPEVERVDVTGINMSGEPFSYLGSPNEKAFQDFLNTLPLIGNKYFKDGLRVDAGIFIKQMVYDILYVRDLKKTLNVKYVYKVDGVCYGIKKKTKVRTYEIETIRDQLKGKHGDGCVLLNDLSIEQAIKELSA